MSKLAQQLIQQERETRSGYLDLGQCGLTEMPDLSDMDWLETLIFALPITAPRRFRVTGAHQRALG